MFPFVHASSLSSHVNQQVTLIGKVTKVDGDMVTVDTSGPVSVKINSSLGPVDLDSYYRFLGKVVDDQTINSYDHHLITNLGDYDPEIAKRVIDAQQGQSPFY